MRLKARTIAHHHFGTQAVNKNNYQMRFWCLRKFPFANPFKNSPPHRDEPVCPWSHGTSQQPRGPGCKPCANTWAVGGWQDEFLSPGNFKEKQKEDAALLPEFEESRTEFINMNNSGEIKDKVRRCDKDKMNLSRNKWQKKLQDKRLQRQKLLKKSGRRVGMADRLKAQTPVRYAQTHNNRTPEQDGLVPKWRKVKRQEGVLCTRPIVTRGRVRLRGRGVRRLRGGGGGGRRHASPDGEPAE